MAATYTVGTGKTYSTIQSAVDAVPGDLSGQGIQTIKIYATAASKYTGNVDAVTGFTNAGASDYIHIIGMVSHKGIRNMGIIIEGQPPHAGYNILNVVDYTRIDNIAITQNGTNNAGTIALNFQANNIFRKVIIYDIDCNGGGPNGYYSTFNGNNKYLYNCMIMNMTGTIDARAMYFRNGTGHKCYNCTAHNQKGAGIYLRDVTINITNCYIGTVTLGNQGIYKLSGANPTVNHTITKDATATNWGGSGNQINKQPSDQFQNANAGSENLHLKNGADCIDAGTSTAPDVTEDINGYPRPYGANYDVGADEMYPSGVNLTRLGIGFSGTIKSNAI